MEKFILLKKRKPNTKTAIVSHDDDVGIDLVYCGSTTIIWPFCMKDLDTGWDIKIPDGHWGQIKSRSSTFYHKKLIVLEGVIDPGYTGPLSTAILNPRPWPKLIKKGERLSQLIIHEAIYLPIKFVNELPETARGRKGFGSTGWK